MILDLLPLLKRSVDLPYPRKNKVDMAGSTEHFVKVDDEELEHAAGVVSKNTKRVNEWGLKTFNQWVGFPQEDPVLVKLNCYP